jgi:hypothetical protein
MSSDGEDYLLELAVALASVVISELIGTEWDQASAMHRPQHVVTGDSMSNGETTNQHTQEPRQMLLVRLPKGHLLRHPPRAER